MQCDDDWGRHSYHDMEIQPVPRTPNFRQPLHSLAQRIEEQHSEHRDAKNPQLDPDLPARTQQIVFWREWPLRGAKPVIVEAIAPGRKNHRQHHGPSHVNPDSMPSLLVNPGCVKGPYRCYTHSFFPDTATSVLTPNRL